MTNNPTFILAGNGSYENRGCEAIVRGTLKIIRNYYKNPKFICISFFRNEEQFKKQCNNENDPAIIHKKMNIDYNTVSLKRISYKLLKIIHYKYYRNLLYRELLENINEADAILSIGGDNYSLDYGIPRLFTDLDDISIEKQKPIFLWGASIGPFDKNLIYEEYMSKHLQKVTSVCARESVTIEYLKRIDVVNNVYNVADPAFIMDAEKPINEKEIEIEKESIGINLSPLMAKYTTNGNIEQWVKNVSEIILQISNKFSHKIYLIPHVTTPNSNDFLFLQNVLSSIESKIESKDKIVLIPPIYNAAETKWIISKMQIFAGSRTHSTIAALSSGVPTLSFAYSIKAKGINQDIFDHNEYCLSPIDLRPEIVINKIEYMIKNDKKIKEELNKKIPNLKRKAFLAGKYLAEIIENEK